MDTQQEGKPSKEDLQQQILTQLATLFIDDVEFLGKVNRLTFGLIKPNNLSK